MASKDIETKCLEIVVVQCLMGGTHWALPSPLRTLQRLESVTYLRSERKLLQSDLVDE